MHFLAGLESVYADRANIVMLPAGGCAPLIVQTDWREGIAGTTRCQAFNEETIRDIVELKPAAVVVSSYFTQFYTSDIRPFPGFLKDFDANIEAIRKAGVHTPIFIMGEVPTWTLGIPNLLGKELYSEKHIREFSSDHLNPESLETDALFSAHRWGENVIYLSQFQALCDEKGCRRFVGPRVPEDMIAMDYGHYTPGRFDLRGEKHSRADPGPDFEGRGAPVIALNRSEKGPLFRAALRDHPRFKFGCTVLSMMCRSCPMTCSVEPTISGSGARTMDRSLLG